MNKKEEFYVEFEDSIKENGCLDDYLRLTEIRNREIYITEEVDNWSVMEAYQRILQYNREDKDTPVDERKPIVIHIDTNGGSVDAGFKLIDAIRMSKTEVRVVCCGYCYSMGLLIYIAGHKRYASRNAKFLLHDGSTAVWDSTSKVRDRLEFEAQAEQRIKDYILQFTKISGKEYAKNLRREWYMFADEAKKCGIVDYIIGVDCDIDDIT